MDEPTTSAAEPQEAGLPSAAIDFIRETTSETLVESLRSFYERWSRSSLIGMGVGVLVGLFVLARWRWRVLKRRRLARWAAQMDRYYEQQHKDI